MLLRRNGGGGGEDEGERLKKHKERTLKKGKVQFLSAVKERNCKIQCDSTEQGH